MVGSAKNLLSAVVTPRSASSASIAADDELVVEISPLLSYQGRASRSASRADSEAPLVLDDTERK